MKQALFAVTLSFSSATALSADMEALARARWISGPRDAPAETAFAAFWKDDPAPVLRRTFMLRSEPVEKARLIVACPAMRDIFVNGRRITSTALPAWTPYAHRVIADVFDVKALLSKAGENELRIALGNGWYNPLPLKMWNTYNLRDYLAIGTPCVRAALDITYVDGINEVIPTDARWSAADGPVLRNSIYTGVKEDLRRVPSSWKPARLAKGPAGRIVSAAGFPPVVEIERRKAVSVTSAPDGSWLVDFGVNATGNIRATLRNTRAGQTVRFRLGELKNDDGTVNPLTAVCGQIKDPAKRPHGVAEECDSVICPASEKCVFEPRFTFHVFRYAAIYGLETPPDPADMEFVAWSSDVRDSSSFTCSNERLNLLHEVCRRTFRSNLQSVQSDCPGREKFGYGGDIACTAEAFWCNWDMSAFYRKTVHDFLDEASVDGLFTETAPYVGISSNPVVPRPDRKARGSAPIGWAVGVPVLLDTLVRYVGDLETLRAAYPALVRFVTILSERYPDDDIPKCLGDWIALDKADIALTGLAHWHQFLSLTAKFARVLGREADAKDFEAHALAVAMKFNRLYVTSDGKVKDGRQGEQIFALYHGLLPESARPFARARLLADIKSRGYAFSTGIFGTHYALDWLSSHGDAAIVGRVVSRNEFPGWFHMIDRGATTLWEDWKFTPSVHSHCHPMFGSVDAWLIRHVLGIEVCDDAIGCDKVRIAPKAVCGVKSASGHLDTPRGRISVSWRLGADGAPVVTKKLPAGVTER